jgi:DNA-binding transcriptional LysR family regulator
VRARPIYFEEYVLLTAVDGPFGERDEITWSDAARVPLCLLTPDMQNRRIIDGIFRSIGEAPVPAMETNSIFNLCSHASTGFWSSVVPRPLLHFFGMPKGTRALRLVEPEARRSVGLIMTDREPPPPLALQLFTLATPLNLASSGSQPSPLPLVDVR